MKVWRFSDPRDVRYAEAGRHGGTWQKGEPWRRTRPLVIEWLPDSDMVGDFTWPGLDTDIIITDRVGRALTEAGVTGFELAHVEMITSSTKSKHVSRKPCVKLPYVGPQLWDLWVTAWAALDRDRSTVKVVEGLPDGSERYEIFGIARREAIWDPQRMELATRVYPRIDGQGLFAQCDAGIFRVAEFPAWILCTNDVKEIIERQAYTNVSFLEMGDVVAAMQ